MKKTTVFIIEKETGIANLIRYNLLCRQTKHVQIFANVSECFYVMEKKETPDFIIVDLSHPQINPSAFLNYVLHSFPKVRVLFIAPEAGCPQGAQLIEDGASDFICKSGPMEEWIQELTKNIEFLISEKIRTN